MSFKKIAQFVALAFFSLMLVACGSTDSSTPSNTTATTTSTSGTSSSTVKNGTAVAANIPVTIAGLSSVSLSQAMAQNVASKIGATTGSNAQFNLYTSATDDPTALASQLDSTLSNAGYKFALSDVNKQFQQGNLWVGLYSKSGSPDLLTVTGDPTAFKAAAQTTNTTNLDSLLNGQKSVVVIVSAPNLSSSILSSPASGTTSAK